MACGIKTESAQPRHQLPWLETALLSQFATKGHLIDACMASAHGTAFFDLLRFSVQAITVLNCLLSALFAGRSTISSCRRITVGTSALANAVACILFCLIFQPTKSRFIFKSPSFSFIDGSFAGASKSDIPLFFKTNFCPITNLLSSNNKMAFFCRHLSNATGASALRFDAYGDPKLMQVTTFWRSAAADIPLIQSPQHVCQYSGFMKFDGVNSVSCAATCRFWGEMTVTFYRCASLYSSARTTSGALTRRGGHKELCERWTRAGEWRSSAAFEIIPSFYAKKYA